MGKTSEVWDKIIARRPVPAQEEWVFKIRRYDGSDSVLESHLTRREAEAKAREMNEHEQTDQYYAERWDPAKTVWPKLPKRGRDA